jgi:hypothetical protein
LTQSDSPPSKALTTGAEPLQERHERFAQLVSVGVPVLPAAYRAGYNWNGTPEGNAANARRLAQRRKIKNRISYFRSNRDAAVLAELRSLVEHRLTLWHETDIGDYFETREEPIFDKQGNAVCDPDGHVMTRCVERMKPFSELTVEQRKAIKSLTWTDSGRPNLEFYSAENANKELRKLNGLDMQRASDEEENFSRMSDEELHQALGRQAAELGINVTLSYEGAGR